ncbi:MAG: hypothetical protein VYB54_04020 [Pseudomonadota bacterium]|nr:hypothetical protein [Pseudomonadota bacterium]
MNMISTRSSNVIDLQYIYYLPFCNIFTSADKFHKTIAPFFMSKNQLFVDSAKIKADLKLVADRWDETDKSTGTFFFIKHPWVGTGMISEFIWDRYVPNWRDSAQGQKPYSRTNEENAREIEKIQPILDEIELIIRKSEDETIDEWDALLNPKNNKTS